MPLINEINTKLRLIDIRFCVWFAEFVGFFVSNWQETVRVVKRKRESDWLLFVGTVRVFSRRIPFVLFVYMFFPSFSHTHFILYHPTLIYMRLFHLLILFQLVVCCIHYDIPKLYMCTTVFIYAFYGFMIYVIFME